ncbi:MAG: flagellar assembly protein FliW [Syntrophobacteraceae bacterium]|jgi:flagellar assembly factor FliW|nr:flagellar assembly protein FliW [Syntrophobacteraceae bacterium]
MQIETSRFGTLELGEDVFIEFPQGIPGFGALKRYVLLEHRNGPFQWLQAVDEPTVAFVVCAPDVLGYRYVLPPDKGSPIDLQQPDDLAILVMVCFDRENRSLRPHLRGPLLLNASNRKAYQWVIDTPELDQMVQKVEKS